MTTLTVLLIEDDPQSSKAYIDYAAQLDDVDLVGVTADAAEGLKLIKEHLPQAIILDLELHTGRGNGFDVLKELPNLGLTVQPYILVISDSRDSEEIEYARSLGMDFFHAKYNRSYSEQYIIDFLRPMTEVIQYYYWKGPNARQ